MNLTGYIAKQVRDIHVGGNWTMVNLKDTLADVNWQEATVKIEPFNTIVALTYHVNYFVSAVLKVLQGGPLDAKDKYSFDHPPIHSPRDWEQLVQRALAEAEQTAQLIEQLPESRLFENFEDEKYGSYYRNLHGIVEHMHYHLGQIVILKKLIREQQKNG